MEPRRGWETTSSLKTISLQRNQGEGRDKLMKVDDDSPTYVRNSRNNNDHETKRMEDLRGKGGGRLKHRTIDGGKMTTQKKSDIHYSSRKHEVNALK